MVLFRAVIAMSFALGCVGQNDVMTQWLQLANTTADPNTQLALDYITNHQNPSICDETSTKYLVSEYWVGGLGAVFHVMSNHLSHAIRLGRVMIFHPRMKWMWTDKKFCAADGAPMSPDCYLEPYSRCQGTITAVPSRERCCSKWNYKSKNPFMHIRGPRFNDTIPVFPGADGKLTVTGDISWWRAVTTKYLFRPNSRLMAACRTFLTDNLMVLTPTADKPSRVYPLTSPPVEGVIGIHIRHGDKKIESPLHPFSEYLDAADTLCSKHGFAKNIILSTDDEMVIEEIEQNPKARRGYTFYYTSFTRINDWGSPIQTAHKAGVVGFIINSFANLILGTHPCIKGFVQTTSSNWNRLINEIRKTDGHRHNAPSIDLEYGEN